MIAAASAATSTVLLTVGMAAIISAAGRGEAGRG
jgi:hypothetical protein